MKSKPTEQYHMPTSATHQVTPSEPFTFTCPGEWPRWIRRFERFGAAAGPTEKPEPVQVNTLACMGDEADDMLRSFTLSEDDQRNSMVKQRFEGHFVKKVIFERARFNRETRRSRAVDAFITCMRLCRTLRLRSSPGLDDYNTRWFGGLTS